MIVLGHRTTSSLAPLTRGLSCVIFVQARPPCGSPLILIEGTKDPVNRLRSISDDNAAETFLVGLINTDKPAETEAQLRFTFEPAWVRGRWFNSTNELMGFIQFNAQVALSQLLSELRPHSHPNEAVDIEEIAKLLKVSTKTVYRLVQSGRIPHLRAGNKFRFIPADVVATLQKG